MPIPIAINRKLKIQTLLDIENPEFARWYELGVWWALCGGQQGNGLYNDRYLFDNIDRNMDAGRYDDLSSGFFPMIGFYLGMMGV